MDYWVKGEEAAAVETRKEKEANKSASNPGPLRLRGGAVAASLPQQLSQQDDGVIHSTTASFMEWDVKGGERGRISRVPAAAAATAAPSVGRLLKQEPRFLTMDDDDDDHHLPSYHRQAQQLHQLFAQELHQVAAAATAEQQQQEEDAEDDDEEGDDEDEEEEEEDEDEEEEEEEEDEEQAEEDEEDALDDDEGEGEDEEEDENEQDDEGREQEEQHNHRQDFELEARPNPGGEGLNLGNGVAPQAAASLVSPVVVPQQHPRQQVGVTEGGVSQRQQQQVGVVDVRPSIRDDWTEPATHALLDAWGRRYVQLNKGNLKQEDWEEVALAVSTKSQAHKTDVQCKNRLDTLKKKYKVEKLKQSAIGSSDSKWPFYQQLDKLLSSNTRQAGIPGAVDAGHPVKSSAGVVDSFRGEHFKGVSKFEAEDTLPNNASTCSKSKESPDMTFISPKNADGTESSTRKRKAMDTPFKTLAKAITKFGEIYEKMEQSKQQQLMDLEKIRMEFTRDLEMQRMQLFMQTQVELAKMKHGGNDIDATIRNFSG